MIYIPGCGDITKRDDNGSRGNTGKETRERMMFESLPESRKSGNG